MKQKETLSNTPPIDKLKIVEVGDEHVSTSFDTPLREDAFELDDEIKIELIQKHFKEIMQILGLDLSDDSLKGTPYRVAKMYVKEAFSGLDPKNKPEIRQFDNKYKYNEMLVEKDIHFYSYCEHHFVPIIGKAHVAYIPKDKVVGLSKINRTVEYFAKRPQVQERMTVQIANELAEALGTDDIAVIIEADHLCVASRGVKDTSSKTVTCHYKGKFQKEDLKNEFFQHIK